MKKNINLKKFKSKNINDRIISYVVMGTIIVAIIIIISFLLYGQKINYDVQDETMSLEQMTNVISDNTNKYGEDTESVSTEIGKTIEESEKDVEEDIVGDVMPNEETRNTINNQNVEQNKQVEDVVQNTNEVKTETAKELLFQKPVEGEVIKTFYQDNLVYSETLEEWTTHSGIDIKADKTTVVKSAEAGVVKSIKNDPRYGLTIVIEHNETFQTVYSNLLTSEFVVEGEEVEKGQSIGTVGNSAVFEIADEPHLHFEILKEAIPVDPLIYID